MHMIEGENELHLTCANTPEGICILRCATSDSSVTLPGEINGRPITALGDYVMSERVPDLSDSDTFEIRISCGGALPAHNANAVRHVVLPQKLEQIGSYAFYNCRGLESISLTDSVIGIGGGALMNCRSLREIQLHAAPNAATCLPKLLGEYANELEVRYFDKTAQLRLLFPAYSEELEDLSPAHIFQRRIHGAGYLYRQCFNNNVLNFHEYDRALSSLLERHDFSVAARVAARRLATPHALSADAQEAYLDCLRAHGGTLVQSCAATGRSDALTFLLSLGVLSQNDISMACDTAREHEQTAALSVLLAAAGKTTAKGRTKTFDL